MANEMKKLKQAFDSEATVTPRKSARDTAIIAAMQAFEEENSSVSQGSVDQDRLKNTGNTVFNFLKRRLSMNVMTPNLKPLLLGGASLAVLSIAVLNVDQLRHAKPDLTGSKIAETKSEEPAKSIESEKFANNKAPSAQPTDEKRVGEEVAGLTGGRRERDAAQLRSDDLSGQISGGASKELSDQVARPAAPNAVIDGLANQTVQLKKAKQRLATKFAAESLSAVAPASRVARKMQQVVASTPDSNQQAIYRDQGRDKFNEITPNPIKVATQDPVSTFSIDVDTASYSFMRASLNRGVLPQRDSVRVEEMINYFPYDYSPPADKSEPFVTHVSVVPTPWNTETKLLHIGIKGYELPQIERPHSNLVFLLDTSGSMNAPNKLPLLVNSFKLLLQSLEAEDTVSIVTYAGSAGTVLPPTKVKERAKILASLDRLRSGGSTAGAEGIRQAYQLAEQNYEKSGVNRVILATDGDFNVGITNQEELKSFVERKRKTGISLSVLGFGQGNYNDALMQTLAQNGNGNAAYIDSLSEARKVLVEEASSTLFTIAKDVKIQIEFNPATVAEYRLIGYETRLLNREDFNNDKIDAGEIGAGHSVTAIYENDAGWIKSDHG